MNKVSDEAINMLKHLRQNVNLSFNYILDDEEPGQHISDGLRLARLASLMSEIQAQLVDFERLSGIDLDSEIQQEKSVKHD